jgi:hypothetical protein
MNRSSWFLRRRSKENFAFLVIRFFRAYSVFNGIYEDFKAIERQERGFDGAGLFGRIRDLEEQVIFDIKEKAHALFRKDREDEVAEGPPPGVRAFGLPAATPDSSFADLERALLSRSNGEGFHEDTRYMFSALRRSLVSRSLDAYIGTGFHMFMILRESLYQLEYYAPKYAQEMEQVERIGYLTQRIGYDLDAEEEHELMHIRQVAELCQGIAADTRELASIALERCHSLFLATAEVMRHSIEEAMDNEVLVLNLLQERELVDLVYGPGAADHILDHMFRSVEGPESNGRQKAVRHAQERCGNVEGLALGRPDG